MTDTNPLPELTDDEITVAAMSAGFALSTAYGQSTTKLMPVSDRATLIAFARAIEHLARSTAAQPVEPTGWKLVPVVATDEMVAAYLQANDAYWRRADELPKKIGKWRMGSPSEATAEGYRAMLAAAPPAASGDSTPPSAPVQGDPSGALRPEPEAVDPGSLSPDDVAYPRDLFDELIHRGSPYAFYLFQWVPYQTDARRWRLKMLHDVRTFDGREALGIWPNGSHCGPFRDDEVEFIRISRKQHCGEWIDPRKVPEPPQAASGERGD